VRTLTIKETTRLFAFEIYAVLKVENQRSTQILAGRSGGPHLG